MKVNGTELKPIKDVSAFCDSPYDKMISPGKEHRRAWALPANIVCNGLNEIVLTLVSGGPVTIFWIDAGP